VIEIETGIVKVTRRVVPAMVVTADDDVVTTLPPADGWSETVTAVG
jgi:hypothetical protein